MLDVDRRRRRLDDRAPPPDNRDGVPLLPATDGPDAVIAVPVCAVAEHDDVPTLGQTEGVRERDDLKGIRPTSTIVRGGAVQARKDVVGFGAGRVAVQENEKAYHRRG